MSPDELRKEREASLERQRKREETGSVRRIKPTREFLEKVRARAQYARDTYMGPSRGRILE